MTGPAHDEVTAHGVLPVVTVDDVAATPYVVDALVAGGLPIIEITLRTPAGLDAIRCAAQHGAVLVGAGSVRRPDDVREAADAGARFVVSPGCLPAVLAESARSGLPALPGVATPTDVMTAVACGAATVKLFPAAALGGPEFLAALAAPFPHVRFVPTGGVTAENAIGYLAHHQVPAVGGTWIAPPQVIAARDWSAITSAAAQAVALAHGT